MKTNDLTKQAIDYLTTHGYVVWRTNAGYIKSNVRLAPKGTPDIIGYSPKGRFVGIEIKGPNDVIRDSQKKWIATAMSHNCLVTIAFQIKDIQDLIQEDDMETVW